MLLTLFIITAIASFALGGIYSITSEPIRLAREAEEKAAINSVMPEFDSLHTFKVMPENGEDSLVFNMGYKNDKLVGTAISTYSNKGYDPTQIKIMVGLRPDGSIINTEVLQQKETPGLGTKMETQNFRDQFKGKNPARFKLEVRKDGGNVDAITAATISSRAFCDALTRAYKTYEKTTGGKK